MKPNLSFIPLIQFQIYAASAFSSFTHINLYATNQISNAINGLNRLHIQLTHYNIQFVFAHELMRIRCMFVWLSEENISLFLLQNRQRTIEAPDKSTPFIQHLREPKKKCANIFNATQEIVQGYQYKIHKGHTIKKTCCGSICQLKQYYHRNCYICGCSTDNNRWCIFHRVCLWYCYILTLFNFFVRECLFCALCFPFE